MLKKKYSLYNIKFFSLINYSIKKKSFKVINNIYNNKSLEKVINRFLLCGKKFLAEKEFFKLFLQLKYFKNKNGYKVLYKVMKKLKPSLEIKKYRKRGRIFEVPYRIKNKRKLYLILKWLIKNTKENNKKLFIEKLCEELLLTLDKKGKSINFKKEMYKKAMYGRVNLKLKKKNILIKKSKKKYLLDIKKSLKEVPGIQAQSIIKK